MELEHAKWVREKRDELYGRILAVLDQKNWNPLPADDDAQWTELEEVRNLALRYASDAVLAATQSVVAELRARRPSSARTTRELLSMPQPDLKLTMPQAELVRHIREELAGKEEAAKTWRRYRRHSEKRHAERYSQTTVPPNRGRVQKRP